MIVLKLYDYHQFHIEIFQNVDPEKQKLKDDLNVALIQSQKNEIIIVKIFIYSYLLVILYSIEFNLNRNTCRD